MAQMYHRNSPSRIVTAVIGSKVRKLVFVLWLSLPLLWELLKNARCLSSQSHCKREALVALDHLVVANRNSRSHSQVKITGVTIST